MYLIAKFPKNPLYPSLQKSQYFKAALTLLFSSYLCKYTFLSTANTGSLLSLSFNLPINLNLFSYLIFLK